MTNRHTIEIFADTRSPGTCRGPNCHARITWAEVVETGRRVAFTGDPVALTTRQDPATWRSVEALDEGDKHLRTCPDWLAFRTAVRS